MKPLAVNIFIAAVSLFMSPQLSIAESPLFMPRSEAVATFMVASEVADLKKEAETLRRKADLLKSAANKKYASSGELRKKAGGLRTESTQKGEQLRSQAQQSAEISGFVGEMFGLLSSMGGGQLSSNSALASSLTGKLLQGQQAMDAREVMDAQGKSGQFALDADKKAGPLELRADELENEANRLMEAHNRIMGIVNAKTLLIAADELTRKIDADHRYMEQLREMSREFASSTVSH